jgi:hypothetical protein
MDWLYELSWWIPAVLAIGALVLGWTGHNHSDRRMKLSACGMLLLALTLALISHLVETDREQVIRGSGELVKAIESRNRPGLIQHLHPQVRVLGIDGRERLADAVIAAAETFELRSARIISIIAEEDEGIYIVRMQVSASFERPSLSNWRLDWEPTPGGWMLRQATSEGGVGFSSTLIEGIINRWNR